MASGRGVGGAWDPECTRDWGRAAAWAGGKRSLKRGSPARARGCGLGDWGLLAPSPGTLGKVWGTKEGAAPRELEPATALPGTASPGPTRGGAAKARGDPRGASPDSCGPPFCAPRRERRGGDRDAHLTSPQLRRGMAGCWRVHCWTVTVSAVPRGGQEYPFPVFWH